MRKSLLIARADMRKSKGQTVAIVVLILLATTLLHLWLMLSSDYHANFGRYHDKLHAEHVTLTADDGDGNVQTFLSQTLENDPAVSEYTLDDCLHMVGTFPYNGGEMTGEFVFLPAQKAFSRSVGRAERISGKGESGVYLPMLYRSGDIRVGKTIQISVGSHVVEYTVCGFFNSVMMGSHNCGITQIVLTEDKYAELERSGYAPRAVLCSVRLHKRSQNVAFEASLKAAVSQTFPNIRMASNCYDIVRQARYISQGISSTVMCVMAFLILIISLVVIVSNIVNHIQVNLRDLGTLKALGYTSRQIVAAQLFRFVGLTLAAALAGIALSYALFPAVNAMMIAQTGIPYGIRFLPLPFILTLAISTGTVALCVWLAARRIKKLRPVTALRSGVQTHSFKRNPVPLEKTKAPLNLALALKTTFSSIKNNVTVCVTVLVLSLVIVFAGLMTENVITDMTPFLDLIVGETADSCISVQTAAEDEFLQALRDDDRVEKAYLYTSLTVAHAEGAELMATVCDDFANVNNKNVVFKGRFPKYDNEIAIAAKYAKQKGYRVGDEIRITANGKTETYLISGFTQITNNLGRDCLFTRGGYERLGEITDASYYINLTKGTDIDAFNAQMKETFVDHVNTTINIDKTVQGAGGVYVSLMTVIVIAILVFSAIVIAFVLYLLVRTMRNNKMRDYGILKALGYTTRQLILQAALSFMPAIALSAVIGIVLGCIVINPLMSLFLRPLGIVKCTFSVPFGFVSIAGVALIALSFGLVCLLSRKIKKVTPRTLLTGE